METVTISDFRSNLLKYLEKASSGCQITVTSNGRSLATICPPPNQQKQARKQLKALVSTARFTTLQVLQIPNGKYSSDSAGYLRHHLGCN